MPKITKLKATQNNDKIITIVDKTDGNKKRKASTSPVKVRVSSLI
jgi:hypothetical protein